MVKSAHTCSKEVKCRKVVCFAFKKKWQHYRCCRRQHR